MRNRSWAGWDDEGVLTIYPSRRAMERKEAGFGLGITFADLEAVYGVGKPKDRRVQRKKVGLLGFPLFFRRQNGRDAAFEHHALSESGLQHLGLEEVEAFRKDEREQAEHDQW